ncbi:MAG: hypothetical protein AAGF11_45465, partial [Myxococcota bacterium]
MFELGTALLDGEPDQRTGIDVERKLDTLVHGFFELHLLAPSLGAVVGHHREVIATALNLDPMRSCGGRHRDV